MNADTYKLGQVSWALWRFFTERLHGVPDLPPKPFLTRIKRLLELDRTSEKYNLAGNQKSELAFHDEAPRGYGVEVAYTHFNAFVLAIGLDLLEVGFKQSEVVFLMRAIKDSLFKIFLQIQRNPSDFRQNLSPEDRPNCPTYADGKFEYADCRVFLLIDQSEFFELYPTLRDNWPKGRPLFLEPVYCHGVEELKKYLYDNMPNHRRKTLVQELALAGTLVPRFLAEAPEFKRGRGGS